MQSNSELIDGLVEKVSALFNNVANGTDLKGEAQRNLRAVIQSAFSKLDMVTREEFDAQVTVLHRSRQKIDALEQQLAELNEQLSKQ
ncbi:MAG: accessory factor UbiK family protein [Pseudomonadales bacterium]